MFLPPLDGSLSFDNFADFHLYRNPETLYAIFPDSASALETTAVSFLEWGRAVHRVAQALRPGRHGEEGEVVGLLANCDTLLYTATVMGMIRAGLVPFPLSPRNHAAAVCSMLEKTNCHRLIVTSESLRPLIEATEAELSSKGYEIRTEELPDLRNIYPHLGHEKITDAFEPYPPALHQRSLNDVQMYLHSSGSTGFPKPITQTVQTILDWCNCSAITHIRDYDGSIILGTMQLPAFHTLGLMMQVMAPLVSGRCIALFQPKAPAPPPIPTPDATLDAMKATRATALIAVPSFYEVWAHSKEAVEYLASLDIAASSGGPLPSKVGDYLVTQGVKLVSLYGATEFGIPMSILPAAGGKAPEDWAYICISDKSLSRWIPQDDGSYELQLLNTETHHVSKINLTDVAGYATSDIFVKHPTKEGLWKIVGRSDDVLILASGEKAVPGPTEGTILWSPFVQGAVMFGRERDEVGVLIEPKPLYAFDPNDKAALVEFRNSIWPIVEDANENAPAFSRIFKEMILVTSPWKPMSRTPKGTVNRKATLATYAKEIEDMYETVEANMKSDDIEPPRSWTIRDLTNWLLEHATDINNGHNVKIDVDLFVQGFDSLSATFLRHRIIGTLRSSDSDSANEAALHINQNIIFANPTIARLAVTISALVDPANMVNVTSNSPTDEMLQMIAKYTPLAPVKSKAVVFLTGSTGSLGSHLLLRLLKDETVDKVYAYNRKSGTGNGRERQVAAFTDKGFGCDLLEDGPLSKVVFLEGQLAEEKLGLPHAIYDQLRTSCTHIIHNAWRLDFNLLLSSFESHILGTRNLAELALSSPHASSIRFLFTSSISVVQSWDISKGPVPEEGDVGVDAAVGPGYGEGKYVTEQVLLKTPLQTTSFRIGQISGGVPNGSWALSDWVPILIKSAIGMGCLPNSDGVVTWIPMHTVAQSLLDIAFLPSAVPETLHIVHPRPVKWTEVMQVVREALVEYGVIRGKDESMGSILPFVSFEEWVEMLKDKASGATKEDLEKIPAIKLLDFYTSIAAGEATARNAGQKEYETGGWAKLSTTKAEAVSSTMREVKGIWRDDVRMWISYWVNNGLFA